MVSRTTVHEHTNSGWSLRMQGRCARTGSRLPSHLHQAGCQAPRSPLIHRNHCKQLLVARPCLASAPLHELDELGDPQHDQQHPTFRILYRDDHIVAIDKPQGFFVHPPEDGRPCPLNENGLWLLKRQLGGAWLYPVHRLDRATSGVTLYCLNRDAASEFGRMMRERCVRKTYIALCRGYTQTYGSIDDDVGGQSSCTLYETLGRFQIPLKVGKWPQSRYSLLKVEPLTGRFHQIRRHFNYISHPLVGDSDHGDRYHNRAFINQLKLPGLYLRAASIEFPHPVTGHSTVISVDSWEPRWQAVFMSLGQSPCIPPTTPHASFTKPQGAGSTMQQLVRLSRHTLDDVLAAQQQQQPGGDSASASAACLFQMSERLPERLTYLPGPDVLRS